MVTPYNYSTICFHQLLTIHETKKCSSQQQEYSQFHWLLLFIEVVVETDLYCQQWLWELLKTRMKQDTDSSECMSLSTRAAHSN